MVETPRCGVAARAVAGGVDCSHAQIGSKIAPLRPNPVI
jgi:hypothetical protein